MDGPQFVDCYVPYPVAFFEETKESFNWCFAKEFFNLHFVDGMVDSADDIQDPTVGFKELKEDLIGLEIAFGEAADFVNWFRC